MREREREREILVSTVFSTCSEDERARAHPGKLQDAYREDIFTETQGTSSPGIDGMYACLGLERPTQDLSEPLVKSPGSRKGEGRCGRLDPGRSEKSQ